MSDERKMTPKKWDYLEEALVDELDRSHDEAQLSSDDNYIGLSERLSGALSNNPTNNKEELVIDSSGSINSTCEPMKEDFSFGKVPSKAFEDPEVPLNMEIADYVSNIREHVSNDSETLKELSDAVDRLEDLNTFKEHIKDNLTTDHINALRQAQELVVDGHGEVKTIDPNTELNAGDLNLGDVPFDPNIDDTQVQVEAFINHLEKHLEIDKDAKEHISEIVNEINEAEYRREIEENSEEKEREVVAER